jgi:hypothetical protein
LRVPTTAFAADRTQDRIRLDTAYGLLWLAVVFDVLAFGIGFGWDRSWHATHPFEDFFSPPHLFIYSMHLCATLTLAYIAFTPELRRWFGDTFALPLVPFPVPGPIALAGGGFVMTGLAGFFDGIWHTVFGLDETLWSFPHSMPGWGLMGRVPGHHLLPARQSRSGSRSAGARRSSLGSSFFRARSSACPDPS